MGVPAQIDRRREGRALPSIDAEQGYRVDSEGDGYAEEMRENSEIFLSMARSTGTMFTPPVNPFHPATTLAWTSSGWAS